MEQAKLANGQVYELLTNGVLESDGKLKLIFIPGSKTFEQIETDFLEEGNLEKIYVLDSEGSPMRSLVGYSQYVGMEKRLDYEISTQQVNTGTEEFPEYESVITTGTAMILMLSKPDLQKKFKDLEETVEFLVLSQLGV